MPKTQRTANLLAFRGEYGRLCTIAAVALQAGASQAHVRNAAFGIGRAQDKLSRSLRAQRLRVDEAIAAAASAGANRADVIEHGLHAKGAVESEWGLSLPLKSGARFAL